MPFWSIALGAAMALHATQVLAAFRPDLRQNVQVAQLEPEQKVPLGATEIPIKAYPGSDFEIAFKCLEHRKQLTFSDCKVWVACCLPGQRLLGTEGTAFDCCEDGQDLVGANRTGFRCCPAGQIYDGTECKCKEDVVTCADGELLVNGKCVCPPGTTRSLDNKCEALMCSSGVQSGKCYTFTFENGYRLGHNSAGFYTASAESRAQQFGKFMLCSDENCTAIADINPGQGFRIKDIHGQANGGQGCKQWLNNAKDGEHITKTPNYSHAGVFVITKWPCGKYCLGGLDAGLGPTCPTEMIGATFTTLDDQSCIPMTLLEVPCDIRAGANNCIWDSKADQCSDYRECTLLTSPTRLPSRIPSPASSLASSAAPSPAASHAGEQVILNATVAIEAQASV